MSTFRHVIVRNSNHKFVFSLRTHPSVNSGTIAFSLPQVRFTVQEKPEGFCGRDQNKLGNDYCSINIYLKQTQHSNFFKKLWSTLLFSYKQKADVNRTLLFTFSKCLNVLLLFPVSHCLSLPAFASSVKLAATAAHRYYSNLLNMVFLLCWHLICLFWSTDYRVMFVMYVWWTWVKVLWNKTQLIEEFCTNVSVVPALFNPLVTAFPF